MESLSEAIVDPGRGRALHALRSRDFRLLWSGQTVIGPSATRWAAGFSGLYSPSQILVAEFGLAAVLWLAPRSIERVRNAA